MPNKTANYNLIKPLGSEHYDINVHNGNMDIIDEELKKVTESNNKRIDEIKSELKDSSLEIFKTECQTTKLDGCGGGFINVDKIAGRTLVNLSKFPIVGADQGYYYSINTIPKLTKGKTITIINNSCRNIAYRIDTSTTVGTRQISSSQKIFVTTLDTDEFIAVALGLFSEGWTDSNKNDLLKVMILEGDLTNKEIPSYFEWIKSVGDNNIQLSGVNLSNGVLSVGGLSWADGQLVLTTTTWRTCEQYIPVNPLYKYSLTFSGTQLNYYLFYYDSNKSYINYTQNYISIPSNAAYVRLTWSNSDISKVDFQQIYNRIEILTKTKNLAKFPKNNLEAISTLNYRCLPISLTEGKTYTVSGTFKAPVDGRQFYARLFNAPTYDPTSLIDIMSANNVNNFSFNIQYSPVYLGICRDPDTTMTDDDFKYIDENLKLQIEEGDKATPYVPYNEGKTEILSSTPWRQWDFTDNNGVKTIGSAQIVLNGNETYGKSSFTLQNYSVFYFKLSNAYKYLGQYDSSNFTCDKFKKQNWIDMYLNKIPEEAISIGDDGFMYIKINNSKLNTQDEAGFKTWLASNPLTVVYQLANPAIENTNKTLNLKAYDNLIVNAGSIQPEVTYSYPKNTGERFVTIEDTVDSVKGTVEDINKNLDEKIKEINVKTSNIKVPVTKVNGKDGEINLSANDIKNSEGKTIETKLNELFQSANSSLQSANSGKAAIAGAVGGVTGQNSFGEIANYIVAKRNEIGRNLGAGDYATMQRLNDWTSQRQIDLANQLVAKGVLASASENLGALISKVANINTGLQYSTGSVIITVPSDYSGGGPGSASVSRIPISVNSLNFKPKTVFYYVDGNSDVNNRLNVDYNSTATSGPKVSYARWTGQFSDNNDIVAEKLRINHNDAFKAKFSDFLIQGDTFNEIFTNTGFSVDISFADSRPYNGGKANVTWLAIG